MATYRDTGLTVKCSGGQIVIPDKELSPNAFPSIIFNRFIIEQGVTGPVPKPISNAIIKYVDNPDDKSYNAKDTFPIPEGLIPGVSELTYEQFYGVFSSLFSKSSNLQGTTDIAIEALRSASYAQGNVISGLPMQF